MNHIKQIAAKLPEYGLDAMMVTSASNERYAIGFHGEGLLLVTKDGAHYSTDGRYIEAAREQVTNTDIVLSTTEKGHIALAKEYIEAKGLHNVGFESGAVTVDTHKKYTQELPCILTPAQELLESLRAVKDEEELSCIRKAQDITDEAFKAILSFIRPGMTEQEVAARLVYEMMTRGGEKVSFDPIVAAGPNGSRPHAVPGGRKLEAGQFITMDFGCKVGGYCSDMTRTVALGQPTEEMEKVYNAVLAAQKAGINAARAGVTGKEIHEAGRLVLQEAGYDQYFTHGFGHSLGIDVHEAPSANVRNDKPMPAGAVISAEPGVYIAGRFGVRIEDILMVKDGGCEVFTRSPKDLIVL